MDSEVTNLTQVKAFSSADYATAVQGALSDIATVQYATRTAIKAAGSAVGDIVILTEGKRIGSFQLRLGNYATHITNDTQEGIHFADNAIASTTAAWVRVGEGPIDVDWFGAVGDNSTDDTAAINGAFLTGKYTGRLTVLFPRKYVITSTIVLDRPFLLIGSGVNSTIIRQTTSTAGGFLFNMAWASGGGIRDMTIEAGPGLQTASDYGFGSSGMGVRIYQANDFFSMDDVSINNFDYSLSLEQCWNNFFTNIRLMCFTSVGYGIGLDAGYAPGGGNRFRNAKISNNGFWGTSASSAAYLADGGQAKISHGIRINQSGGEFIEVVDITAASKGVVLYPHTGKSVLYLFFTSVLADTSLDRGWEILATAAGDIVGACEFVNCWAAYGASQGLLIYGPYVDELSFIGFRARQNDLDGIYMDNNPTNINFTGGYATQNSEISPGTYAGIKVLSGTRINFTGFQSGNMNNGTATQGFGAIISSGVTGFANSCDFSDNSVGAAINVAPYTFLMSSNTPTQTVDVNEGESITIPLSSITAISGAGTRYLTPFGQSTTTTTIGWVAQFPGICLGFDANTNAQPGGSDTFVYTVMNSTGGETAMAATQTAAQWGVTATDTNAFTFAKGDHLDLRMVSTGAATPIVRGSLKVSR